MPLGDIFIGIVCIGLPFVIHIIVERHSSRLRLVRKNYKGKDIFSSYGIVAFPWIVGLCAVLSYFGFIEVKRAQLHLAVIGSMWFLGGIDDIFGDRKSTGFRGHFGTLLRHGKITTGALKAFGGGIVGAAAGYYLFGFEGSRWIVCAILLPFSCNVINLFDVRPGRASSVFFFGIGVTYIMVLGRISDPALYGMIIVVALVFWLSDARGLIMMGDAGSNALGSALGLAIVLNTGTIYQWIAVVLFASIQVYSELRSISTLIEGNRILRAIDRRLGVR